MLSPLSAVASTLGSSTAAAAAGGGGGGISTAAAGGGGGGGGEGAGGAGVATEVSAGLFSWGDGSRKDFFQPGVYFSSALSARSGTAMKPVDFHLDGKVKASEMGGFGGGSLEHSRGSGWAFSGAGLSLGVPTPPRAAKLHPEEAREPSLGGGQTAV